MLIDENGVVREMTEREISEIKDECPDNKPTEPGSALVEMAAAISTASTLAQMRAAARAFLEKTESA